MATTRMTRGYDELTDAQKEIVTDLAFELQVSGSPTPPIVAKHAQRLGVPVEVARVLLVVMLEADYDRRQPEPIDVPMVVSEEEEGQYLDS